VPFGKIYFEKVFSDLDPYSQENSRYESLKFLRQLDMIDTYRPDAQTIFEIGCGEGHFTKVLADRYPDTEILTVDISRQALCRAETACRGRDNVCFLGGDILDLLFSGALGEAGFDVIIQSESLYYLFLDLLGRRSLFDYFRAITGLLVEGGIFVEVDSVSVATKAPVSVYHWVLRRLATELEVASHREWCELRNKNCSYDLRVYRAAG